jgi:hypothetical protein
MRRNPRKLTETSSTQEVVRSPHKKQNAPLRPATICLELMLLILGRLDKQHSLSNPVLPYIIPLIVPSSSWALQNAPSLLRLLHLQRRLCLPEARKHQR